MLEALGQGIDKIELKLPPEVITKLLVGLQASNIEAIRLG